MTMLPQPPPNAPAPPPSPEAIRSRRKWRALWLVGTASILILSFMLYDRYRQQQQRVDREEAISHLRSMSMAFFVFEPDYGGYPSEKTAKLVRDDTGTALTLGNKSSNDYFRQFLAVGSLDSEIVFYAAIPGTHKPDHLIGPSQALAKGEVGFSYIVGLSSAGNPKRPLVVTPLIPGTNRFDPKPFGGYAIILPIDGTITRTGPFHPINKNGEVIDSSGKHILDPANPIWGGEKPVIAWPDL